MVQRKNKRTNIVHPAQIAGRYATNKYFASNQSLIFIGPYLLDEALACSYKLEQRKVPIYGYASQYYDAVAAGKIIVTGTISINYVDSNYLYLAMIESLRKGSSTSYQSVNNAIKASNRISGKIADLLGDISSDGVFERNKVNSNSMKKVAQMIATDPIAGEQVIKLLRKKYWENSSVNKPDDEFIRNISQNSIEGLNGGALDFDQVIDESLFARPDSLPPINITVSHGNPFQRDNNTYRVIREVNIISFEQHMSPTGQPQSETYHFIARSII